LEKVVEDTSAFFIHPYNNYSVIAGQATSAFEIFQSKNDLDYVLTPVGGGGLLSGTLLSRNYFSPGTKVIAGEPSGADDAYRSLIEGKIVPSINPDTIADGLLTSLGDKTFKIIYENIEEIIVVSDAEIIEAMKLLWERMKIIVEPSGAVPFAALLRKKESFKGKQIGIILSGGNVDLKKNYFNR
jgi:threonine dehydratase